MTGLVSYQLQDSIATVTLDDGKVNVLSRQMLRDIDDALDRAAADGAVVVLTGRPGVLSAGFDLRVLRAGDEEAAADLVRAGFELAARMLSFPRPVVIACTGHAIAIGLTMPRPAVEICRQRLTPAHFNRAVVNAEVHAPDAAVEAGFLDRLVDETQLAGAAREVAEQLRTLDLAAHAATKLRARDTTLAAIRVAIDLDYAAVTTATVT